MMKTDGDSGNYSLEIAEKIPEMKRIFPNIAINCV
jgi:hypothetical protein